MPTPINDLVYTIQQLLGRNPTEEELRRVSDLEEEYNQRALNAKHKFETDLYEATSPGAATRVWCDSKYKVVKVDFLKTTFDLAYPEDKRLLGDETATAVNDACEKVLVAYKQLERDVQIINTMLMLKVTQELCPPSDDIEPDTTSLANLAGVDIGLTNTDKKKN